jgi:hypothetical protein
MWFSGRSDCHMRRLQRIQWRAERICIGLMRSTHVLSVEILAGLPPIRQRLSFLNERFKISAMVKPNDLLMVKLEELHWIWNNLNCFSNRRLSVRVGWFRGRIFGVQRYTTVCRWVWRASINRCSYKCSETPMWGAQPPFIPTVQKPRVCSDLGYFWMTGTRTVLDCLDTVVGILLLKCASFIFPAII